LGRHGTDLGPGHRRPGRTAATGHTRSVVAVAAAALPFGRVVAVTGSHDDTMRVWDVAIGRPIGERFLLPQAVTALGVVDSQIMVWFGRDGAIMIFDPDPTRFSPHVNLPMTSMWSDRWGVPRRCDTAARGYLWSRRQPAPGHVPRSHMLLARDCRWRYRRGRHGARSRTPGAGFSGAGDRVGGRDCAREISRIMGAVRSPQTGPSNDSSSRVTGPADGRLPSTEPDRSAKAMCSTAPGHRRAWFSITGGRIADPRRRRQLDYDGAGGDRQAQRGAQPLVLGPRTLPSSRRRPAHRGACEHGRGRKGRQVPTGAAGATAWTTANARADRSP
jgi:hypothetical protein